MATLQSGLPEQVAEDEDLARFLVQSNQFNATLVKPALFLPSRKDRETSISRHGAEPSDRLWKIGVETAGGRKLYGAAIIRASDVSSVQLKVVADEPPPRHAVIRDWPWIDSDPDLQKAQQKEKAALLASAAGPPLLRKLEA